MIERLVLVRHGETVHNVAGIAQGWNDSPLSERGASQVEKLADRVAKLGVDAIFSSSLDRALSTAAAIARVSGLPVTPLDDLREMSYGEWEGRSFLDVRREDATSYRSWIDDPEAACPGGESHAGVRRRIERAIERVSSDPRSPRNPLLVTHGTAIRIAATTLLALPVTAARHFAQDNASINIFIRRGDQFVLKVWNDATHCDGL